MKKKLLVLFALVGATSTYAQVPKIPLVEHFTQASCGPCAGQNPTLKATLDNFGAANYVRISHQVSWPGYDPMHDYFTAGPDDRVSYYGITGVPNTVLNGGAPGAPNTVVTTSTLTTAAALMTPYKIVATQNWTTPNSITVNISIENVTSSPISLADKIFVTMMENEVTYPTPPGTNGETSFEYVMRQMYNASTGAADATSGAALGTIAGNSSQTFSFTIPAVPSYIRDKNEVSFAIYLQNAASKTIYQAGRTAIVPIAGVIDVASVAASVAGAGYCDLAFTPKVTFTNNDATVITSVVAEYTLNGGAAVQQTYSGSLATGQSTTISFPVTNLVAGSNVVTYEIISVNGGQNWVSPAALDMADEKYNKLNGVGVAAPIVEGFETAVFASGNPFTRDVNSGVFEAPASVGTSLFSALDGSVGGLTSPVGGFANSDNVLMARFWNIPLGNTLNYAMNAVNFGATPAIKFSHAHRKYLSDPNEDKLEIFVSSNCGATWTSVYNQSGANLATKVPSDTAFFPKVASDWKTTVIALPAFANMSNVVVRFEMTSGFGNNLFIDDINLQGASASIETLTEEGFNVYPNPASEKINVAFEANGTYEISIVDLTGRTLTNNTLSNVSGAQVVELPVNELASGNYILSIVKEGVKFTQKIVVE